MDPSSTNLEDYSTAVAILASYQPFIVNFIKAFWLLKIANEEKRKCATELLVFVMGMMIAVLVDTIGGFHVGWLHIFIIGGGVAIGSGQLVYKTNKYAQRKIDEFRNNP